MAEDFQVKITTTGDPKGADQVAAALGKVTKATVDQGKESRTLAQDLTSLGSRQNATKDVVEGLDQALKGNANSMFGVAKAAKNLYEIFTVSTPAGRALQLALIGVNAALTFLPGLLGKSGESAGDTAKDFDAMRKAADEFNKVRFDTLNAQLDALKAKSDSTMGFFKRLADLSKTLDDASMSLELAQLNATAGLSPEEKTKRELGIRDRYGRRGLERDEGLRGQQLDDLRTTATGTRAIADSAEAQRAMDAFLVTGLRDQRRPITDLEFEITRDNQRAIALGDTPEGHALNADLMLRGASLRKMKRESSAFTPGSEAYLKTLEARLQAAESDAAAKKEIADKAQRKLDDALRLQPLEERTGRDVLALQRSERYTAAGLPESTRRHPGFTPEPDPTFTVSEHLGRSGGNTETIFRALEMFGSEQRMSNQDWVRAFQALLKDLREERRQAMKSVVGNQ